MLKEIHIGNLLLKKKRGLHLNNENKYPNKQNKYYHIIIKQKYHTSVECQQYFYTFNYLKKLR